MEDFITALLALTAFNAVQEAFERKPESEPEPDRGSISTTAPVERRYFYSPDKPRLSRG